MAIIVNARKELPPGISYQDLSREVGCKAAGLLAIQMNLPHISTAQMVVGTADERPEKIADAALRAGILGRVLVRASTIEDDTQGYEGRTDSRVVMHDPLHFFNIDKSIQLVQNYPAITYPLGASKKASVIVAQEHPSLLRGTIVEHPNQASVYHSTVQNISNPNDPVSVCIRVVDGVPERVGAFSGIGDAVSHPSQKREQQVAEIAGICHDIRSSGIFPKDTSFQVEFGLEPSQVFQVRSFLPFRHVDFEVENPLHPDGKQLPFVYGVTPEEGIEVTEQEGVLGGYGYQVQIGERKSRQGEKKTAVVLNVKEAMSCPFQPNVVLYTYGIGLFAHHDVSLTRGAEVTVVNGGGYYVSRVDKPSEAILPGDTLRVVSNGKKVSIKVV